MSIYEDARNGLIEAIEYEKGNLKNVKTNKIHIAQLPHFNSEEVKKIRAKQQMTQLVFSEVLGVSKKTVEAWESGHNIPSGPAQRMLYLLDVDDSLLERNAIVKRA